VTAIVRHCGAISDDHSALLVRAVSTLRHIQGMSSIQETEGDAPEMTIHHGESQSVLYLCDLFSTDKYLLAECLYKTRLFPSSQIITVNNSVTHYHTLLYQTHIL
jgi:hypothetical protein